MTATEELRRLLDKRGVEYETDDHMGYSETRWDDACAFQLAPGAGLVMAVTPEQAVEATLGRGTWVIPMWERWHKSLRHDEVKSIGDAVEQLMYEAIEFGGDMGPNGNTYNGIDEGDVLTTGFITEWVERFENMLGPGTCNVEGSIIDTYEYNRWEYELSCGHTIIWESSEPPNYCPNCGRKVKR